MRCGLGTASAGQGFALFFAEAAAGSIAAAATPTMPCSASRRVTISSLFIELIPSITDAFVAVGRTMGIISFAAWVLCRPCDWEVQWSPTLSTEKSRKDGARSTCV